MIKKNEIFAINTGEYEDNVHFLYKATRDFDFYKLLEKENPRNFDDFTEFLIAQRYCKEIEFKNFYLAR